MKKNIELILVVAMCKITSAFDDIAEIESEKIFKGTVKHSITSFQEWYNKFSSELYKIYYEKNAQHFEGIITEFNKYESYLEPGSKKEIRMGIAYLKLESAKNDLLDESTNENPSIGMFSLIVCSELEKLLKHGFWNQYTPDGSDRIAESLKKAGESLYMVKD